MGPREPINDGQWESWKRCRYESARKLQTYIFDIDGTLALKGERNPYNWHEVGEDSPNLPVVYTIHQLQCFSTIVIVSGRDESCRWQTEMWLAAHGILFAALFMRPEKDGRPDHEIKKEIWLNKIQPQFSTIVAVFDDRQQCVDMWRSFNIPCFQVAEGKF